MTTNKTTDTTDTTSTMIDYDRAPTIELTSITHTYQVEDVFGEPDIDGSYDYHTVSERLMKISGVAEVITPCPAYGGWTITVDMKEIEEAGISDLELRLAILRAITRDRVHPVIQTRSVYIVRR